MENYRIYERKEENLWEKTSYYGNKKVITKIFKILKKSKFAEFSMEKE